MAREKWTEKKNLWRYRVKILLSMTQYNLRTRLEPNLFSGHFDKAGTILVSRYAHSLCATMTQGAETVYTTSLTSVASPNYWTISYSTGFWHDFFRGFSFLSIFRVSGKTSVIRVELNAQIWVKYSRIRKRLVTAWIFPYVSLLSVFHWCNENQGPRGRVPGGTCTPQYF